MKIISQRVRCVTEEIRSLYNEQHREFDRNTEFLESLKIVESSSTGEIKAGNNYNDAIKACKKGRDAWALFLSKLTIKSDTVYGEEIRNLLRRFSNGESGLEMRTTGANDSARGAQDALVTAGLIDLNHRTAVCTLPTKSLDLFYHAKYVRGISPKQLSFRQKRQFDIGLAAELAVLEEEKKEVGSEYADLVTHIALTNIGAGFDIASFRVSDKGAVQERLIEVKAISRSNKRFFMTHNEYQTAVKNRGCYFLYLVPINGGKPDVERIMIYEDPITRVLENKEEWNVERGAYECKRIEP